MDNEKLLISIYQNTSTALQSINDLTPKTEDERFKDLLNKQYQRYEVLKQKIEEVAESQNVNLKDNNWFEKAKLWSSIQMSTLADNSTRHLAELMLVGTVMGTLTCYKNKNDFGGASEQALELLKELERTEEDSFKELKKYLKE